MLSPSLVFDTAIGGKLVDFVPPSVVNVALAFSIFVMQPAWNDYFPTAQSNPFRFAMNAIGDLFSSMKPKEILIQLSPTPTIKGPPTPTLQYQPESTSSIFYVLALCSVLILLGAVFTLLRNNTAHSSPPSSEPVNVPCSTAQTCHNENLPDGDVPEDSGAESNQTPSAPSDDPIDPSNHGADSESKLLGNDFKGLIGDIGGSPPPPPPPSFTTSGMADDSDKNPTGFWEKLSMLLIILAILTTLIHGGRITQKMAIRDNFTFSYNNASVTPYLRQALELVTTKASHFDNTLATFTRGNTLAPKIVEKLTVIPSASIPSTILQVKSNEVPSSMFSEIRSSSIPWSQFSSGPFPLPAKYAVSSNQTSSRVMTYTPSAYPVGLSLGAVKLGTPTISGPSKVALALKYIKMFTVFFVFCIFIPILSFAMTTLPAIIQFPQFSKSELRETFTRAGDDRAMKLNVDVNKDVLAVEVVKNSKVDTNITHDEVVPVSTFMNKGKGKALETIEENDETTRPLVSDKSLDLATPKLTIITLPNGSRRARNIPPRRVRVEHKRKRKAEKAVIAALLNAVSPL